MKLRAVIERITYQNGENGYSILKARVKGYDDLVTLVGNMLDVTVGTVLVADGQWKVNRQYGSQFVVESYEDSPEFKTTKYFCKTNFNLAEIKKEEAQYVDLPKIYAFKDARQKEVMLNRNCARVNREIYEMIKSLLNSA
jgi:ATP-dependent exoDNAse (exonuclease V) alpha subunit